MDGRGGRSYYVINFTKSPGAADAWSNPPRRYRARFQMTATPVANDPALVAAAPRAGLLSIYLALTKARLSALVVLSAMTGFVAATPIGGVDGWRLLWTAVGTACCAGAASALNQLAEIDRDRRMHRTCGRPLPAGRIGAMHALIFSLLLAYVGATVLAVLAHPLAAVLAMTCLAAYVLVYTPLKPRTSMNTLVGAVCGAIPPLLGWAAATGSLRGPGAWVLAALLLVWQLPHFLALAWLYRDDYRRGGYRMLPNVDGDGELTGRVALLGSLILLLLALVAPLAGLGGWWFAAAALALGAWMTVRSRAFHLARRDDTARALFRSSLVYLTVVLLVLVLDRHAPDLAGTSIALADATTVALP